MGSALASRNEQYERFYLASGARNYQLAHALAPKERAQKLVDGILGKNGNASSERSDQREQKLNLVIESLR